MERRLNNWARWRLSQGRGALGFAHVDLSKFEELQSPHDGPAIPTWSVEASETDDAVMKLPSELRRTVEIHYLGAGSQPKKAAQLCVTERTMRLRIQRAHQLLGGHFASKADKARAEQARVQKLQRAAAG
jgi:DNA-directed RNA polymerase specialized sigma24 family protein